MRRVGAVIVLAAVSAFYDSAWGADAANAADTAAAMPPSSPAMRVSVRQALAELQQKYGYAFIFDSRLLEGKNIFEIGRGVEPETGLRHRLAEIGLALHKVSADHYAITPAPSATVSPQMMAASAPGFSDVILVTAAAPHEAAALGKHTLFELNERYLNYYSGKSAADAVQELPQTTATFTPVNTSLYGPSAGLSFADLRGLGAERNLILVNGRPATPTIGGNFLVHGVDLSRFAKPFLDRIEVEPMSAGARYGAGAAVGAVNFVMREGLDSFEAGADFGVSERGDNKEAMLFAVGGKNFLGGDVNITGGVAYTTSTGLIGVDRKASAIRYDFSFDDLGGYTFEPGVTSSPLTGVGLISGVVLDDGSFAPFPDWNYYIPQADGSLRVFTDDPKEGYNALAELTTVPAVDRILGYSVFSAQLSPSLRLFAEGYAGVVKTDIQLAPLPVYYSTGQDRVTGNAAVIPLDNPTAPPAIVDFVRSEIGDAAQSLVFNYRYVELGPRRDRINRQHLELVAGAELGDDEKGKLAISYHYHRTQADWIQFDRIDIARLKTALDADACAAASGCALADFFDPAGLSAETRAFIVAPELHTRYRLQEHGASVKAAKAVGGVLADEVKLRLGAELRRQTMANDGRSIDIITTLGAPYQDKVTGALTEVDVYAGGDFPVLRSSGLAGDIDLAADFRLTASPQYETATNVEIAGGWRPLEGVAIFTRHQFGHRPPNIVELFSITNANAKWYVDPCGQYAGETSAVIKANCASATPLGVAPGFTQDESLVQYADYGNPDLDLEGVRAMAAGLTVEPTALFSGLPGIWSVSAVWRSFHLKNPVTDEYDPLYQCYSSVGFADPACGVNPLTGEPSIRRDPTTRQLSELRIFALNAGGERIWRGLDLEMRYAYEPANTSIIDRFWAAGAHTYTDRVTSRDSAGGTKSLLGLTAYPRHESLLSFGVERRALSLAAQIRRRGRVATERSEYAESMIAPAVYADASLRYAFADNAYVQFCVENIADRKPPIAAYTDAFSTLPSYYDLIGRRFTIATRLSF